MDLFSPLADTPTDRPSELNVQAPDAAVGRRVDPVGSASPESQAPAAAPGGLRRWNSEAEWRADVARDLAERLRYEVRYVLSLTDVERERHLREVRDKRGECGYRRLREAVEVAILGDQR
jgi:hypothetical protein